MEVKKPRINNTTDLVVDRISDLPDSILGHILSFLLTDNAVATSILSKRWKFVWVSVHNLKFYNLTEAKNQEFVRFVNRVLLLNDSGWLNNFTLVCNPSSISPQFISWINSAITRNVHHFHLHAGNIDLPTGLFSCESLRSLVLYDFTYMQGSTAVCLPRLESLTMYRVCFKSEEAFEKLLSGCPILDSLSLSFDGYAADADDDFTCIICSTSLRRLDIYFEDIRKLKLKASSLEHLSLSGHISEIFVERSLSSLVEADFDIWLEEHDFVANLIVEAVRAFDCVKFLTVSADVIWAFSLATINLSTEFKRLVKLVAGNYCCPVQDFIHNSENLEELIIHQDYWWTSLNDPHDHSRWRAPVEVPRCLSNSLKRVRLDGYKGLQDEREMIRYMLEHGSALEVMQICCNTMERGEKLKLIQEIRVFSRKSRVCKVQFSR